MHMFLPLKYKSLRVLVGHIFLIKGNRVWGCGLDSLSSGKGQVADSCEHGNEPSGSIKCGEFLDWLSVFLAS
jgi:hypothetical protein